MTAIVTNLIWCQIGALPGGESAVNGRQLEYKKAWGIDITNRVRELITGSRIDVAESELPQGRHTVEIQISDVEKSGEEFQQANIHHCHQVTIGAPTPSRPPLRFQRV
jgi:hypothetical protein